MRHPSNLLHCEISLAVALAVIPMYEVPPGSSDVPLVTSPLLVNNTDTQVEPIILSWTEQSLLEQRRKVTWTVGLGDAYLSGFQQALKDRLSLHPFSSLLRFYSQTWLMPCLLFVLSCWSLFLKPVYPHLFDSNVLAFGGKALPGLESSSKRFLHQGQQWCRRMAIQPDRAPARMTRQPPWRNATSLSVIYLPSDKEIEFCISFSCLNCSDFEDWDVCPLSRSWCASNKKINSLSKIRRSWFIKLFLIKWFIKQ